MDVAASYICFGRSFLELNCNNTIQTNVHTLFNHASLFNTNSWFSCDAYARDNKGKEIFKSYSPKLGEVIIGEYSPRRSRAVEVVNSGVKPGR